MTEEEARVVQDSNVNLVWISEKMKTQGRAPKVAIPMEVPLNPSEAAGEVEARR